MGWDNLRGAFGNRDVKTKIFNSPESHGYEQGNDPPLEPKFSMNDKGSQVKTPGQYANATNGKSPTGMNPMPVPGPTSAGVGRAGQRDVAQYQMPENKDQDQGDVDVIIKLSALKKLRDGAKSKEKPAKKVASRSVKDDDGLQVQR